MTTIAYRAGVIAADTLTTAGRDRVGYTRKIGGSNGLLWGASGDAAWCKGWRDWLSKGAQGDPATPPDDNTGGLVVLPDDSIMVFHARGFEHRIGLPYWADGSGADFALGAMHAGASAEEAVRAAMAWDTTTGGDVTVLRRKS